MRAWNYTQMSGISLWTVAAVAAAIVVTIAVLAAPELGLLLLVGLGCVALSFVRPFLTFALAFTVIVLSATLAAMSPSAIVGLADEAAVALCAISFTIARVARGLAPRWLPGLGWFMAFAVMGVISGLLNDVSLSTVTQGAFLAVKAIIFAFAAAQLDWTAEIVRKGVRWGVAGGVIILLAAAVNLVVPREWSSLILGYQQVDYQFGLPSLMGPFVHPAAFSRIAAILAIGALVWRLVMGKSKASLWIFVLASLAAALSFRVKTLVALIGTIAILRFQHPTAGAVVAGAAVLPLLLLVLGGPVFAFILSDFQLYFLNESARLTLILGAVDVARTYAPFGAGFGQYGSFIAADQYSSEYLSRGFHHRDGMSPTNNNYLNDNQWPAILGETGWPGLLFFILGIIACGIALRRARRDAKEPVIKWVATVGIAWIFVFLIESVASPVYSSAPGFPFAFVMVGVVAGWTDHKDKETLARAGASSEKTEVANRAD
ncbi:hypothetical protein I2485_14085 [Nesterenkonia sp. E16_7]|uniref:hypothetical protein n=1 Tax=unclassified Nesterenkonia TaxID=2629769 RepID=UPI001A93650C|nr:MULTISPECIES: hypothetical protein [unclassified Nesterenkonia]MBO0594581.1 hypothetical protein [Nesterenkonia sp. E16_10]MBO0599774.1 hypothetical protein [Nesterenkonia sp. E16_7]